MRGGEKGVRGGVIVRGERGVSGDGRGVRGS